MKPNTITLPAPAKINRFLHIIGRRSDGYHLLQTIFQFIDLADELTFTAINGSHIEVHCDNHSISETDNLVTRSAKLLQSKSNTPYGACIQIKKHLPIGGGLGGGSSDAATTLIALNYLWNTQLSIDQLAELGLQLGADVPVFVRGQAAWGEGIGEKLRPVELDSPYCVLLAPDCHVDTPSMFKLPELPRATKPIDFNTFLKAGGHNDFEVVVRKYHPPVEQAFQWLEKETTAYLSGSGGCVFALFEDKTQAEDLYQRIPSSFNSFLCQTFNTSPLHIALNRLI